MIFKRTHYLLITIFACLMSLASFAQPDTININTIVGKAQAIATSKPLEKVHVHFDKPYYAVGDTMWFKAYLTSNLNLPSPLSKVVYLDVTNNRDSLVQTLRLPVDNASGSGHLVLNPLLYHEGAYHFRAYTRYMLNFSDAYFFNKTISFGNTINKELVTQIKFSGQPTDKGQRVSARIQYKDDKGKSYALKRVSWRIVSKFDVLATGKGTTDQNGFLNVSAVVAKVPERLPDLETEIAIADDRSLSRLFPMRTAFNKPDIQFLPEGGRFLSGIPMKVAFKAIRADGLGIEAKGTIVDNTGATVAKFATQHLGMGAVSFVPEAEKTYKANVQFEDGTTGTYELSKPRTSSLGLSVGAVTGDKINIRIAATPSYLERHQGEAYSLVARSAGVICYAAQLKLVNSEINAGIPTDKFPEGIVQLTVFTPTGSAVSERLVFINHTGQPKLVMTSDKPTYNTRQKVHLGLATQYTGSPVEGNYSLSVIDESKVPFSEDSEISIKASLLLTSDLAGYVEMPNYYFNNTDEKKLADLDLLMLTQGYRAYAFRDILDDKITAPTYSPEQGIVVSGTLRMKNGMPVSRGNLQFIIPERSYSVNTQANAEGRFIFPNLNFPDSTKAILSARGNPNSQNMMIMVDGEVLPGITPNISAGQEIVNIDSVLSPYLANSKKLYRTAVVLQDVVIKASKPKPLASHKDYPALSGLSPVPDHLMMGDRFQGCNYLIDCLRGGMPGITFSEDNFYITRDYNAGNRIPAQIFLNGMPVDLNALMNLRSTEIESIEIFLRDELGTVNRMYNTNGVIAINSKKAPKGTPVKFSDLKEMLPQTNLVNFNPMGYEKPKAFYSPKYAVVKSGPVTNDLRTTIYWNPSIKIDESGKTSVDFFNADGRGSYKAIVEGIDKNGSLIRSIFRYTVK